MLTEQWLMAMCWRCAAAIPFGSEDERAEWVSVHAGAFHPAEPMKITTPEDGREHTTNVLIAVWNEDKRSRG